MTLRTYVPLCWAEPTSLNSRPLLSYNVLEYVLSGCEVKPEWGSHDIAPFPQPLL